MSELIKTLIFGGIAVVVGIVVFLTRPSDPGIQPNEEIGQKLFPDLKDPQSITSLEIKKFDESNAKGSRFKVAKANGVWSIPTQENYPADAADQIAKAATSVMDVTISDVITDDRNEHGLYGVVNPESEKASPDGSDTGTLVRLQNEKGDNLAQMIIGKTVPEREKYYFVRRKGQDRVYVVQMDTSKLSTQLFDWIERDLLKIDQWNIKQVEINDYTTTLFEQGAELRRLVDRKAKMAFKEDGTDWKLASMETFEKPDMPKTVTKLPDDEEPNKSKLDELKRAVDDLKIVGVKRKPSGLIIDVETGVIRLAGGPRQDIEAHLKRLEGISSLRQNGFYPSPLEGDKLEISAAYGDLVVRMNDGVEYLLQFGNTAGTESKNKDDKKPAGLDDVSLKRYVMMSARVNEKLIEEEKKEDKEKKLKEAKDKVRKMNVRFSEWYFVISEKVYNEIRLTRADAIKKKEKKPEEKKDDKEKKDEKEKK